VRFLLLPPSPSATMCSGTLVLLALKAKRGLRVELSGSAIAFYV
jgi:hypothetical protein